MTPDRAVTEGHAFESEVLPHLDALYRFALHLSGAPMDAEDLVQETMLKAFRAWDRFQPGTNVRAWLKTILRNEFFKEWRKRRRQAALPLDFDDAEEVINLFALAIRSRVPATDLKHLLYAYPTTGSDVPYML